MIGYFKTASDVGLYNAALPLAQLFYLFPYALFFLFLPVLSNLYAQNKKEIFKPLYKTLTKWVFLLNMIILSFFILFPKQIINTLFGQEYLSSTILAGKEILPAPVSLIILSFGLFCGYLMYGSSTFFLVIKRTKLLLFNASLIALINLILNYFLIPPYGIVGAAIATSTSFFAMGLLLMIEIRIILKIWPFKKSYLRISFSALLSLILTYLFSRLIYFNKDIYNLIVLGVLFLVFYFFTILILTAIQEKTGLKISFINKLLKKFT